MKETVISWTIVNFVTLALMLIIIGVVFGAGAKLFSKYRSQGD